MVDSLKALDLKRPIREAEIAKTSLIGAKLSSGDFSGAKLTGPLEMSDVNISGSLFLRGSELSEGGFVGARIGGNVDFSDAKITGKLT